MCILTTSFWDDSFRLTLGCGYRYCSVNLVVFSGFCCVFYLVDWFLGGNLLQVFALIHG